MNRSINLVSAEAILPPWLLYLLSFWLVVSVISCDRVDGFYVEVNLRDLSKREIEDLRNQIFDAMLDHNTFCDLPGEDASIYDEYKANEYFIMTCSQADTGATLIFLESDCTISIRASLLSGGFREPRELERLRLAITELSIIVAQASQVKIFEGPKAVFYRSDYD